MKRLAILAGVLMLSAPAWASDHGPVFGYATPVNSQGEVSCDTGIFERNGNRGTQLSTGTACGYGLTPHLTFAAFVPATFGSGSLLESRIFPTGNGPQGHHGGSFIPSRRLENGWKQQARWPLWCRDRRPTQAYSAA